MFTIKTTISNYQTFSEFAEAFALSKDDIVITQSFLYEPFMKPLNLPCTFILQDKFGRGEPSDEMMNNILKEVKGKTYSRVIGIGNAGVGAVHALSYPLGGGYHVPHGESNYQFLTEVFKVYFDKNPDGSIRELNEILARNLNIDRGLLKSDPRIVYQKVDELLNKLVPKNPLRHYGMKPAEIDEFPVSVLKTQQRLLANNYVPLGEEEIRKIYQALY